MPQHPKPSYPGIPTVPRQLSRLAGYFMYQAGRSGLSPDDGISRLTKLPLLARVVISSRSRSSPIALRTGALSDAAGSGWTW